MKKMRKLLPAFAMLLVSAVMMSTASFAWFSMSTTAAADGMQVKATASSSLVISGTKQASDFATADQDFTFTLGTVPTLTPITHNNSADGKLYAPENTNEIDPVTGALKTGNDLVELTGNAGQYYDFKVYVAAAGTTPITMTDFTATVTTDATALKHIHNAITIDFWVAPVTNGSVGTAAYQGRTNLLAAKGTGGSVVSLKQTVIPQLYGETEVQGDATVDCLEITMRVYFDGALLDDTTTTSTTDTYIRNLTAVLDAAGFAVKFSAV